MPMLAGRGVGTFGAVLTEVRKPWAAVAGPELTGASSFDFVSSSVTAVARRDEVTEERYPAKGSVG
jgi:hypothetical protein